MRIIPLILGILIVAVVFFTRTYRPPWLQTLGCFRGLLIVIGLFMPSRRKIWEKMKEKQQNQSSNDPEVILKKRYASGEITKEEYDKIIKDIGS